MENNNSEKLFTTNYQNTFIEIAEDCPIEKGAVPPEKNTGKTIANIQYDMISKNPYKYTSDDVLFQCYLIKNEIKGNDPALRKQFFSKGQPCLRASPLTKQYGWGIHYNDEGKIAMYGCETAEYKKLSKDSALKIIKAIRSKRK